MLPGGTQRSDLAAIALMAGLLVAIALVKQGADLVFAVLRTLAGEKLVLSFRADLFRHVQRLSLSYHDTQGASDSTYRIQYDAPAIQWITVDAFLPLLTAWFTLAAMVIVLVRIDWQLAAVALVVAPLLLLVSQLYSRRLKVQWREAKDLESSAFSVVQEVLSAVRVVKVFAQEDREQERYVDRASKN